MPLSRLVYCYLAARAVLWAVVLHLTQPSKPLDVLEHLAWAREFQLVYEHHPGAVAWIVGLLDRIGGGDSFLLSLPAPIATSLTMLAVWQLALRITDEKRAVVATLSLEGIWYFGVVAAEFNHNILQLAAWAFVILAAHRAFLPGKQYNHTAPTIDWLILAVAAAFSLYAKYSSALLLGALLSWSIVTPFGRRCYKQSGIYLAMAFFALLTAPQIIALAGLELSPFRFAISRATEASSIIHHITYPARFLLAQCGALSIAVFLCLLANDKTKTEPNQKTTLASFFFIMIMATLPVLVAVGVSATTGLRFRSHWGAPMLSFLPLALVVYTSIWHEYGINLRRFVKGAGAVAAMSIIIVIAINTAAPFVKERGKRIHYPGEQIGKRLDALWQEQNPGKPLTAVVGSLHLASLVSFYAPSRPRAVINGNWSLSYGVPREEFQKTGGIIIWTITDGKTTNTPAPDYAKAYITKEFPTTPPATTTLTLNWQTPSKIPPLIIGIITIPPADTTSTKKYSANPSGQAISPNQ